MNSFNKESLREAIGSEVEIEVVIHTEENDVFTSSVVVYGETLEELADAIDAHLDNVRADIYMKLEGVDGVEYE